MLVFVGLKMAVADLVEIPTTVSMAVIVGTLLVSIAASFIRMRRDRRASHAPAVEPATMEGR